jgi:putative transposase
MDRNKIAEKWQDTLINQNDFMQKMMYECLQGCIQTEFNKFINAKEYERTDERKGLRNGSYERQLQTRVGSLTLKVCRDREGAFKTELFDRYQRSEKALVASMIEMYASGVSTRKVSSIVEELCGVSISKSHVSDLTKQLDAQLLQWRNRRLEEPYPYLMFDARYEKIRENGCVVSKAFVVAVGITKTGIREIIGTWVVNSESYEAWDDCFKSLKDRGLHGVEYAVTDSNKGLRSALQKYFQDAQLQRCQVHFMRNFVDKLAKSEQSEGIRLLQEVFAAEAKSEAMIRVQKVKDFLNLKKKDKVADWLEENIEETLAVLELPIEHRKKMKSTNMLERVNQELKRRSRVVRIFPNSDSCVRLLGTVCQEISEGWANRTYLTLDK